MNSIKKLISFAALGFSVLSPFSASGATDSITANVPFAFVVNGRTMPAGFYEVETGESGAVLYIRSGKSAVLVASNPAGSDGSVDKPGLVFERRQGTVYLVGVRMSLEGKRSLGSTPQASAVAFH